ncbi:anaerobic sulfite reductase subunit AsrA [Loigolactobacillus binensis]|uniref:Anaerobic sulfite reductase subunit AsrA n=1 Tax=Loigolactobacillus binensis TaxID=2559922 RepID=A0ABW3ED68_9LACO|nr:anaerobic sulfite reductase subunit AsrA [Loigolactobacillus binensis]
MTAINDVAVQQNRQQFYLFLARLYEHEVSPALLRQLRQLTYPTACGEVTLQAGYDQIHTFLTANSHVDAIDDLAVDYAKVFLAAGEPKGKAAFPYESVYTSKQKLIMQEAWEQVQAEYAAAGLALVTEQTDIKEDHIAVELKFMAHLVRTEASLAQQQIFLHRHLLNWVPQFCQDIARYSRTTFYPGVAKLTLGFLQMEAKLLVTADAPAPKPPSYALSYAAMDQIISQWQEHYHVYAPKLMASRNPDQPELVRFGEINSVKEIVTDRQSDFSAKEIYYPIMQTLFYFNQNGCQESQLTDDKDIILFLHPCDINALKRTDNIFLKNGGNEDIYYKRLRDKLKIVLLECEQSLPNCFCVSMHTNVSHNYSLAVRLGTDGVQVQVQDPSLAAAFSGMQPSQFTPKFVTANKQKAVLPEINNTAELKLAGHLDYWHKFDNNCIGCGGCNTVCPTCTCFDTTDVRYNETSPDGERRRVWSSCMLDSFTRTAGGRCVRKTPGANMRFKVLHKVYDYRQRFGGSENMCVGCGRCIARCPQDISVLDTINEFHDALEKAKSEVQ